jgi:hypothetical protein
MNFLDQRIGFQGTTLPTELPTYELLPTISQTAVSESKKSDEGKMGIASYF